MVDVKKEGTAPCRQPTKGSRLARLVVIDVFPPSYNEISPTKPKPGCRKLHLVSRSDPEMVLGRGGGGSRLCLIARTTI